MAFVFVRRAPMGPRCSVDSPGLHETGSAPDLSSQWRGVPLKRLADVHFLPDPGPADSPVRVFLPDSCSEKSFYGMREL